MSEKASNAREAAVLHVDEEGNEIIYDPELRALIILPDKIMPERNKAKSN